MHNVTFGLDLWYSLKIEFFLIYKVNASIYRSMCQFNHLSKLIGNFIGCVLGFGPRVSLIDCDLPQKKFG